MSAQQFITRKKSKTKITQTPNIQKQFTPTFPVYNEEIKKSRISQTPAAEKSYQNLQQEDQQQQIMQLEKELAGKKEKYRILKESHRLKIEELLRESKEPDEEIGKLQQIVTNADAPSIAEQNKLLEEQIEALQQEKAKQEELQQHYATEIEKIKNEQKDLDNTIRSLPQCNRIEELKRLISKIERDTNQKIIETESATAKLNEEITKMREDIDALNLDAEDLHQQNIELYNQKQELQKQFTALEADTTALKFTISQQKALVTPEYFNQQIDSAKKKNQMELAKFREKTNEIIRKAQEQNQALKQEIMDQDMVIKELSKKVEERNKEYETKKAEFSMKLKKERKEFSKKASELYSELSSN